jgi:hypothetical protein
LKPDPKKVEAQKKAAEEYWKEVFEADKVPMAETAHFLIVGGKPGADLLAAGGLLEQQYTRACKVLELEREPTPWQGKLTVYLVPEAKKYPHMIRVFERRKVNEDEIATHDGEGDFPFIAACAGKQPGDLGALGNAGIELGALVVTVRAKTPLPGWLTDGFGRATVLHAGPASALAAERKKASVIVTKSNRGVADIFNDSLKAEEQPYLRSSFADYMAYSGRTAKFLPFIEGFRPDPKGNARNLAEALKNANTNQDELNNNWQKYVKSFK